MLEDACYVCSEDWQDGDEMVRAKCQCPYWLHEACSAKVMFEAGGCPSCRIPTDELDEAFLLGSAAGGQFHWVFSQVIQSKTRQGYRQRR